ncbi:MAG: thrombospondin type 3 repeat-containing protein [Gammaproteobacteria bacterium]
MFRTPSAKRQISCLALLLLATVPANAFELLVEVTADQDGSTVVGPYVARAVSYADGSVGGNIRADYRDRHMVSSLQSVIGRTATARSVLADSIDIRPTDAFVGETIDISWRMVVRATSSVPREMLLKQDIGVFRWRLITPIGSDDQSIALTEVFDGTLATDGQYAIDGVLSLPVEATILNPYQIFASELGPTLQGNLVVDAYTEIELPDGLDIDVVGCTFLDLQSLRDTDEDGINDAADNCRTYANPLQVDANLDGIGNLCDGDFNDDGAVNMMDLGLMRNAFFSADPMIDMDSNGVVSVSDLALFKRGYLSPPGLSCVAPAN